jgi:hypothetical protein
MPHEDVDFENLKHQVDNHDEALLDDAKEIKQLKAEIAGLRENLKDVLRILNVVYGTPFVQPGMPLLPEQRKGYNEALDRLRKQYFEFPDNPS